MQTSFPFLLLFWINWWVAGCPGNTHTHTHTHLMALFPGLPRWAGTRNVKPMWILLKQETVSGSGISWAICKSARRFRQITTRATHHSVFYRRVRFLPPDQQRQSTEDMQVVLEKGSLNVSLVLTVILAVVVRPGWRHSCYCGEDDVRPATAWNGTSHIRRPTQEWSAQKVHAAQSLPCNSTAA